MNLIYPLQETDDGDRPEPFSSVTALSPLYELMEDAADVFAQGNNTNTSAQSSEYRQIGGGTTERDDQ